MSRRVKYLIIGSSALLTTWAIYDGYQLVQKLRKPLNSGVLSRKSEFIYISRDYFREPVRDLFTSSGSTFDDESLVATFIYNVTKKLSFTKVGLLLLTCNCDKNKIFFRWNML